jgi:hypothetical protein
MTMVGAGSTDSVVITGAVGSAGTTGTNDGAIHPIPDLNQEIAPGYPTRQERLMLTMKQGIFGHRIPRRFK